MSKSAVGVFLLMLFLLRVPIFADFANLGKRYHSAMDLEASLLALLGGVYFSCDWSDLQLEDLGLNLPLLGKPVSPQPTAQTVFALKSCFSKIESQGLLNTPQVRDRVIGPTFDQLFFGAQYQINLLLEPMVHPFFFLGAKSNVISLNELRFGHLKLSIQQKIIEEVIMRVLGPDEVILDHGLVLNMNVFREHLRQRLAAGTEPIVQALLELVWQLFVRDERLSS